MIRSLCFVFALLFLLVNMILVYKVPYRISVVKSAIVCFVTEICMGALIAQVYSIVNISIDLYSVGIGLLIIGAVLFYFNIKNGKVQKLCLDKIELCNIVIICVWFAIVFIKVFTVDVTMNYVNVDPANHFNYAMNVIKRGKISSMYFAELYNGLFIQIFQPMLSELNYYKAFIIGESLANLLNVLMFYCVGDFFAKNNFTKYIMSLICFLYFMGWPFYNYAVGGFVHFGWGVTLTAYIVFLLIVLNQTDEKMHKVVLWMLVIMACYCVLICYMYFIPVVGLLVLCCFWSFIKKNHVHINMKLKVLIGSLIVCAIIAAAGIGFFGFFRGNIERFVNLLNMEGGIHRELYKDFIFMIPPVIYIFIRRKSEKKLDEVYLIGGIILGYIAITFLFCYCGILSPYYYYKSYYLLWFFIWAICIDAIDYFANKDRLIIYSYGGAICLFIFASLLGVENSWTLKEKHLVPNELTGHDNHASFSIYGQSELYINREKDEQDWASFSDICRFINDEYADEDSNICFVSASYYMGTWFRSFTGGKWERVETKENVSDVIGKLYNQEIKYIVMHQNSLIFRECMDLFQHLEKVYDNGYYCLYK